MSLLADQDIAASLVRHARSAHRLRLEVSSLLGDEHLGREIERSVSRKPGVVRVTANARSGRVLIELAPDAAIIAELEAFAKPRRRARGSQVVAKPYARDAETVATALGSSAHRGISEAEAKRRLERFGANLLEAQAQPSRLKLAASQLANLPTALLLGSALVAILLGDVIDATAIVTVVGVNAAIGYRMERTSERLLAGWQRAEAGMASVIRNGQPTTVPASRLVPGDVLLIRAGDVLPADARIVDAHRLFADESPLTGESEPVAKSEAPVAPDVPLGDRSSMLYRGTSIASGHGRAIVTATGCATELGEIQRLATAARGGRARLATRLDALASKLAWSGLAASGVSAVAGLLWRRPALELVRHSVALGVAAIPEGLPVTSNAALVRAMSRMRERGIVVRRLATTETLGGITVACADKTGTLTENEMRLEYVWIDGRRISAADIPAQASGPVSALLGAVVLNSDLDYQRDRDGALHLVGSSTERALVQAAQNAGIAPETLRTRFPRHRLVERTDETRYVISEHDGIAIAKGAPEQILELCGASDGALAENERLASEGLRVLAAAVRAGAGPWRMLGLVALRDPLRAGSVAAVQEAARAGIRTVMLTGDQRQTAEAIAHAAALEGEIVEGIELPAILADPERLRRIAVVARVTPADKVAVIEALRSAGEIVAMAGDGVNDAPALQAADVGIAVGVESTDLARQTADIVLERADLRAILTAIAEGRIVQDNLRRSVRFQVAGNLGEVITITSASVMGRRFISPLGVLWINMITDTLPGLALALESGHPEVLARPPAAPSAPILDRGDWRRIVRDGSAIAAASGLAALAGGPLAAFAVLGAAQFSYAASCRSTDRADDTRRFALMVGGSSALHLGAVAIAPVRSLLGISGSLPIALASFAFATATPLLLGWLRDRRHEVIRQGKV
ncbi:MAG: cation-transporting P-type ATPase [Kofleriaceae bacterium]|nr:cation-transporting P-type ATPase [Kofleriaceae bacterium]